MTDTQSQNACPHNGLYVETRNDREEINKKPQDTLRILGFSFFLSTSQSLQRGDDRVDIGRYILVFSQFLEILVDLQ